MSVEERARQEARKRKQEHYNLFFSLYLVPRMQEIIQMTGSGPYFICPYISIYLYVHLSIFSSQLSSTLWFSIYPFLMLCLQLISIAVEVQSKTRGRRLGKKGWGPAYCLLPLFMGALGTNET